MNLINNQPDIEAKCQYLINKREKVGLDHFKDPKVFIDYSNDMQDVYKNIEDYNPGKDPKVFIDYSNDMQDVYKNIEDYNPGKKRKMLIVFHGMIADIINNKKLNPVVTELFIRGRKRNISIAFIIQLYFKEPKDVILNCTHFFTMKIPNKREPQQIALNHSPDIDLKTL